MSTTNDETMHDTHLYDPKKHDNQIIAVFDDRIDADAARKSLVASGIADGTIQIIEQPGEQAHPDERSVGDQILTSFMGLFSSETEHHDYAHAVAQGHVMLVVTPDANTDRHQVIATLETCDPIDFDAKLEEWRQAGYDKMAQADDAAATPRRTGQREPTASTSRVRSYLAERP